MLLKVGVVMMTLALAFAGVVAVVAFNDGPSPKRTITAKPAAEPSLEPLVRSYSYLPRQVRAEKVEPRQKPEPQKPEPSTKAKPITRPEPSTKASRPEPQTKPESRAPEPELLPIAEAGWPMPTDAQLEAANRPRHYRLPPGAIMGLTVEAIGIYNVPVFDSDSQWALDNGVSHVPETSLPWSHAPQRNVYLAGHRLGWPGTWSHLVFYNLDKLGRGDKVLLKNRQGRKYEYRVTEVFVTEPEDSWVMGQVRGRDMVTLQTCTPIPSFSKRLIVRADRV
jgi:sortase A